MYIRVRQIILQNMKVIRLHQRSVFCRDGAYKFQRGTEHPSDKNQQQDAHDVVLHCRDEIIDTMQQENRKLVVMARFTAELDDIEALLQKRKIGYSIVRGGIKDRDEQVRRFQEDEDCRVFIGQIQAAGMGLTLTAASTRVFFSLD